MERVEKVVRLGFGPRVACAAWQTTGNPNDGKRYVADNSAVPRPMRKASDCNVRCADQGTCLASSSRQQARGVERRLVQLAIPCRAGVPTLPQILRRRSNERKRRMFRRRAPCEATPQTHARTRRARSTSVAQPMPGRCAAVPGGRGSRRSIPTQMGTLAPCVDRATTEFDVPAPGTQAILGHPCRVSPGPFEALSLTDGRRVGSRPAVRAEVENGGCVPSTARQLHRK